MSIVISNGIVASDTQVLYRDMHGTSIFTTILVRHGKPQLWPLHWQRLTGHAQHFGYSIPPEQELLQTIEHYTPTHYAKARILINQSSWAQTLDAYEPPSASVYDGVSVIYSSIRPHPQLGMFKTTSYLPYALAHQEAVDKGVFEALMCNDQGYVVDGSRTSLLLYDGVVMTSLLGGLEGCMRQSILAYAQQQGIATTQAYLKPHELRGQLILSNSLIGAVPVGPIDYAFVQKVVNHFR